MPDKQPTSQFSVPSFMTVIAATVIVGYFVMVGVICLLLLRAEGLEGNKLALLILLTFVVASLTHYVGTVITWAFGSSYGSRRLDNVQIAPPAQPTPPLLPSPVDATKTTPPESPPPVPDGTRDAASTQPPALPEPIAAESSPTTQKTIPSPAQDSASTDASPSPGIGPSTDASVVTRRRDRPVDNRPASIRYNNPGAAWENARAPLFGMTSYGVLRDGNHIADFPHGVNGAAYNFDLLDHSYVGLTIAQARKKWTNDVSFLSGYDQDMVLTREFVRNPTQAIPLLKEVARWEAGKQFPLTANEWAQAHAMFLTGSADAWLQHRSASVGLTLADKIVSAMERKKYAIDREQGQVNIVYVEGMSLDGTVNDDAANVFNDIRTVIGFKDGKPVLLGAWEATTEPGRYYTDHPINAGGAARIALAQFAAWQVGMHRGDHEALVQTGGEVTVYRDLNKDGLRTGDKTDTGFFGINQHWGYDQPHDDVGKASAGCLVGRLKAGHVEFMRIVKTDPRFLADKNFVFKTAILAEHDVVV